MGKAVSLPGGRMVPGGDEKSTFVDAERDGVSGNEIGYASIDEEAGVINKSGYPPPPHPVVEQTPAWSWIRGREHPER